MTPITESDARKVCEWMGWELVGVSIGHIEYTDTLIHEPHESSCMSSRSARLLLSLIETAEEHKIMRALCNRICQPLNTTGRVADHHAAIEDLSAMIHPEPTSPSEPFVSNIRRAELSVAFARKWIIAILKHNQASGSMAEYVKPSGVGEDYFVDADISSALTRLAEARGGGA